MSINRMRPPRGAVFALALAAACFVGLTAMGNARAEEWPNRPVTMVVPYNPGASNDTFTRALADILTKQLGQPFIVENRSGAGGFTGSNSVVKAAPDGYTFLEMPNSIAGFKPIMKVDLDPSKDLIPIALMARSPTAMIVPASLPVKTVKEFIEYAKARPDQTFYGMAGIGTTNHQHSEMFKEVTGLKVKGVNYKNATDVMTELVAGRIQHGFVTTASARGLIESGKLTLLAYTDSNFPPESLKAPTMAEAGVPGMEKAQIWWAIFGPLGLPKDIVTKMNAAINQALKDPGFVALIAKSGATPAPVTPEAAAKAVMQEIATVEAFAKSLDIK
jgi:tripartite-type tricarboxylate transporter receptor subunit TctC